MFGLFKKSLSKLDQQHFYVLGAYTAAHSYHFADAAMTMEDMVSTNTQNTFDCLLNESFAFNICLVQMGVQRRFKLESNEHILQIVLKVRDELLSSPIPQLKSEFKATKAQMLLLADNRSLNKIIDYVNRDIASLDITETEINESCQITGQSPSIIRGAGWTLALLMHQIRVSRLSIEDFSFGAHDKRLRLYWLAQEMCNLCRQKIDHILAC